MVHHSAERAHQEFKVAASLHPVLAAGACASRTERTQRELHRLRQAASDARNPLEEAVYQRVAWMKSTLRCDSATGGAGERACLILVPESAAAPGDMGGRQTSHQAWRTWHRPSCRPHHRMHVQLTCTRLCAACLPACLPACLQPAARWLTRWLVSHWRMPAT